MALLGFRSIKFGPKPKESTSAGIRSIASEICIYLSNVPGYHYAVSRVQPLDSLYSPPFIPWTSAPIAARIKTRQCHNYPKATY